MEFLYELREANTTVERLTEQKHWLNIITTVIIGFAIIVSLLLVFLFRSYRRAMRTNRILTATCRTRCTWRRKNEI